MTNSSNKSKKSLAIVAMLFSVSLIGVSMTNWESVRSVDMVKLISCGMLLGALLTLAIKQFKKEIS